MADASREKQLKIQWNHCCSNEKAKEHLKSDDSRRWSFGLCKWSCDMVRQDLEPRGMELGEVMLEDVGCLSGAP